MAGINFIIKLQPITMSFKPLKYTEQECGKKVANTKRKYIWIFDLNGERYQLQLICSFISGKRSVILNSLQIHETKNFSMKFEFQYLINSYYLRITQKFSLFTLVVDNMDFISTLRLNHEKSKQRRREESMRENQRKIQQDKMMENKIGFGRLEGNNQQKSVSNIKISDFDNFFEDIQKEQKLDIELSEGSSGDKKPEIDQSDAIRQKQTHQSFRFPAAYQINRDPEIEENQYQHEQQGLFQTSKTQKQVFFPSPKQIFIQKKNQLLKFLKL